MNQSPLRSLLAQHLCSCRPSYRLSRPTTHTFIRPLSTHSPKNGASTTPYNSHGSSEFLKRRYQPTPSGIQLSKAERAKALRRIRYSAIGIFFCSLCMLGTVYTYSDAVPDPQRKEKRLLETSSSNETSFDAPPVIAGLSIDTSVSDEVEQVPTGTSTIPTFPKTIHLSSLKAPSDASIVDTGPQEYQLVGLGIRTVSFLGIQVYVVGLYIALPDISTLQERLIRTIDPVATTLVAGEKDKLKELLLDPEKGEEVWNAILKDGGIRTVLRIVPTRNTDFMHLRDGWVRGITGRTQHFASTKTDTSFEDDSFGQSLNEFKAIWGGGARKNVPKGETLLLTRDAKGQMAAWYEDKKTGSLRIGGISDERISRLIWLCYLGGKTVSSEGARQDIINGCMEYVGRPVGTVATQVV